MVTSFQFLIGRLGTKLFIQRGIDGVEFQFLIGRLGTRDQAGKARELNSFNSS